MIDELQASILSNRTFATLDAYRMVCLAFLNYLERGQINRIPSLTHKNYIFYQYGDSLKITRPLNMDLYLESSILFETLYSEFLNLLHKLSEGEIVEPAATINRVIYTIQQSIGCISDSFANPNQARKRVGQLFEQLIRLIIQAVGVECESRTVKIPIPGHVGYQMPYELDLVFSRQKDTSEKQFIYQGEIVGSVKTTSKDRIDKIFLDKFLLTKLLGKDIPVIAIFLHDVQRAQRGEDIFSINSTFKTNHFLGYTVALNKLDGVYYIDPRPEMLVNERLHEQIKDFSQFLTQDLWLLFNEP